MSTINHFQSTTRQRKLRVRSKIKGTTARPRLSFFRSNQHIYLQLIDDETGRTLLTCSDAKKTAAKAKKITGTKTESAQAVAKDLVAALKERKIKAVVIDRGPYKYHGRVKAAVEVIREAGVEV